MAGYALGYEDGGAIPDDDQDNGPATVPAEAAPQQAPPTDGESSASLPDMGDPPVAQELAQETPGQAGQRLGQQVGNDIGEGLQNIQKDPIVKRIASYLMGDGGADPAAAKKFQVGVQHEYPGVNPDDANLLAVHKAFELGGPQAAWQMVQYNRTAYNAKQSFAEAALQGVQNKAPDLHAAADAATQASQHVLDGSSTKFTAGPSGVTAAVTMPGTTQATTYQMTPQQFAQATSVGKDAQWDRLMETGGMPALLARIVGRGAQPQQGGDTQGEAGEPGMSANEQRVQATGKASAVDPSSPDADQPGAPGMYDARGRYLGPREPLSTNYGDELEQRSLARFGKGNVGMEPQRQQWMAEQEDKELNRDNAVKVANEKGVLANKRAEIMSGGKVKAEETKGNFGVQRQVIRSGSNERVADKQVEAASNRQKEKLNLELIKLQQQAASQEAKNRIQQARIKINDPNFALRKPGDVDAIFKEFGLKGSPAATPAPNAPTPTTTSTEPNHSVPPVNQRVTNQVYTTPKGQFRWMGNGWQPVQ